MTANAKNLSTLANVLDDGTNGQFLQSTGSGGIVFADVAAGASVYDSAELLPLSGNDAGDMAYVNSTNRFYINNGTGWYSISLVNTNPNITSVQDASANTTPFTLATDGTATVITITANDPEQVPLTYNYSVTSGSLTNGGGTTATITQSDNVFTVTPSTTEAYAGTFELTFTTSDGINTATSANSFTLSFITTITNSRYTTLLATATGTSDNNNITDASTNNHSITVTGDAHAGTFSPYRSGGYSTYFDGTTNTYLNVSSSSGGVAIGSGDFTISFWAYANDTTSPNYLLDYRPYNVSVGNYPHIRIHSDGTFKYNIGGTTVITGNTAISSKQWAYFCLARDNGTTKMYVNGTLQTDTHSGTESLTNGANRPVIGTGAYAITPMFDGYISDLRVVTSLDTTAYSVPTERLEAVTNTQLLTCHLPYISDGSTNDHSITVNGGVSTKPFSPYDYAEYSATDHGGSVYFDGNGDYLDTNSAINLSSGGCIEGWVYITSATNYAFFIASTQGTPGYPRWYVGHSNATDWRCSPGDSTDNNITSYDLIKNQWNHFVLSNDGSTSRLFANGVLIFTKSVTPVNENLTFAFSKYGSSAQYLMTGNLSDVRVTTSIPTEYQTSSTTVGSSIFTPPTAPLSSSGASLHIKGTDASIIDKSQGANLKLVNTTGSTAQVKFAGSKSMYTGGNSAAKIRLDASNPLYNLSYGQGDFTVEGWFWTNDNTNNPKFYMDAVSVSTYWQLYYLSGTGITLRANNTGIYSTETGDSFTENTWHYIALCRAGSNYKVFHNGTEIINVTSTHQIGSNSQKTIGGTDLSTGNNLRGYIQDLRITKGLARYSSTFTPPTALLEG